MNLDTLFKTHRLKDLPDFKKIKTQLLTPLRPAHFVADSPEDWRLLLTAAVQLSWGSLEAEADLSDTLLAKQVFMDKVVSPPKKDHSPWLDFFPQMGTHIPKTHNDKVSWAAFHAQETGFEPVSGGLTGVDCTTTVRRSGAGNGSNVAHYTLLSLLVSHKDQPGTLVEWIAKGNKPLKEAFASLGVETGLWEQWVQAAADGLSQNSNQPIDRYMKQIYLPSPDGSGEDVLITPLPSTALLTAFEVRRRADQDGGYPFLPKDTTLTTQVGGTKPQNAGSLVSYMAGYLRHLQLKMPTMSTTPISQRLIGLKNNGPFWLPPAGMKALKGIFEQGPGKDRQVWLRRLDRQIKKLLQPGLFRLNELEVDLARMGNDSLPGLAALDIHLQFLLSPGETPHVNLPDSRDYLRGEAVKALKNAFTETWNDNINLLVNKAVEQLFLKEL